MDGKIRCSNCEQLNDVGDVFCAFCGVKLSEAVPVAPVAVEVPVVHRREPELAMDIEGLREPSADDLRRK